MDFLEDSCWSICRHNLSTEAELEMYSRGLWIERFCLFRLHKHTEIFRTPIRCDSECGGNFMCKYYVAVGRECVYSCATISFMRFTMLGASANIDIVCDHTLCVCKSRPTLNRGSDAKFMNSKGWFAWCTLGISALFSLYLSGDKLPTNLPHF